jgi:hypothetical protein
MVLSLLGCHRPILSCRSEYLCPPYLASEQVNTPDPIRCCFFGQQIVVSWNLPKRYKGTPLTLVLHIRDGNRTIQTISTPIEDLRGKWIYRLVNQDYWDRGGILAFQAQLCQEGEVIGQWDHYLWVKIIEIHAMCDFLPFVTETETGPETEPSSGLVLDSELGAVSGPVSVSVTNGKKSRTWREIPENS